VSNMFQILCMSLAKEIGKDEILCRGLLRVIITNNVKRLQQITDPVRAITETNSYTSRMSYQEWKTILESPGFSQTLSNVGISDSSAVTARLMQTLVEQQSLFTMEAR